MPEMLPALVLKNESNVVSKIRPGLLIPVVDFHL